MQLSAGKRRDDQYTVFCVQLQAKGTLKFRIHKNSDMRTHIVLLVDHAKADAGILPIKIAQHCRERFALTHDVARAVGVLDQRCRQPYFHTNTFTPALSQRVGHNRINVRQMQHQAMPLIAFIKTRPDFTAGGTKIQSDFLRLIGTHRLAFHC